MTRAKWLGLQLFGGEGAVGAGDGGSAAATGGAAADAGQHTEVSYEDKLRTLGVPESKIRKKAGTSAAKPAQAEKPQQTVQQFAAATEEPAPTEGTPQQEEEKPAEAPALPSFEEFMEDPENNRRLQGIIRNRLKAENSAKETLSALAPALDILSRNYGLDPAKLDAAALSKAVTEDQKYYEDRAISLGVDLETAMRLENENRARDEQVREAERLRQEAEETLEHQRAQQHVEAMRQQGEALKATFPAFDLMAELRNPAFARMTSPGVGISVEDAYYAIHRKEIQAAAMQVTAQQAAKKISNAIQSGQKRPEESGTSGAAPSVTTFDYKNASREQREALKRRIREAGARGEKLYPGQ